METTERSAQHPPTAITGGETDRALLEEFVARHNEAAFALLVQRHGPPVYGVCQRVLRHLQDAEDAFQATFLVLARQARSIRTGASLSGWLYRVAFRIALKAKKNRELRQVRETELRDMPEPEQSPEWVWRELRPVLDAEVSLLPSRLRLPFVLCYLHGKTNEEAARQLGCPVGTVLSRLARARERLRGRLTRRGLTLSAVALAAVLSEHAAAAGVPAGLAGATAGAAVVFVGGQSAAGTVVPPAAAALARQFLRGLLWTRLTSASVGAATVALLTLLLLWLLRAPAGGDVRPPSDAERVRGVWKMINMEIGGQANPPGNTRMVFDDGQCQLIDDGGQVLRMSFQLDPTRTPPAIDLEYYLNNNQVIGRGIYRLESDTLRICYSFQSKTPPPRPSQFATRAGFREMLFTLQREKANPRPDEEKPAR
jgi:RNA polymerase sigma factor (sigma-70 family)